MSSTAFKVLTDESASALFVIEHASRKKGGPPRHLHHNENDWFYVIEGNTLRRSAPSASSSNPVIPSSACVKCRAWAYVPAKMGGSHSVVRTVDTEPGSAERWAKDIWDSKHDACIQDVGRVAFFTLPKLGGTMPTTPDSSRFADLLRQWPSAANRRAAHPLEPLRRLRRPPALFENG